MDGIDPRSDDGGDDAGNAHRFAYRDITCRGKQIGPRWRSLRVRPPHGVDGRHSISLRGSIGELRRESSTERERDTARRGSAEFIEAGQFFGGAFEEAEGGGLQCSSDLGYADIHVN
jgi:hypothetical protein